MASSVNRRIEGYLSRVMGQRDPAGLIRPRPTEPIRACGLAPRHQAGHMTAIGLRCRHAEKSLRGRGHPHMTRWGAMSVLCSKRAKEDPWLVKLLASKQRKVAACALANKACPVAGRGWRVSAGR